MENIAINREILSHALFKLFRLRNRFIVKLQKIEKSALRIYSTKCYYILHNLNQYVCLLVIKNYLRRLPFTQWLYDPSNSSEDTLLRLFEGIKN